MIKKKLLIAIMLMISFPLLSQEKGSENATNDRTSKISLELGMNIPFKPNSINYGVGMSVTQLYEFLFWDNWSLVESLGYNFISGKNVNEYYDGTLVNTEYENFQTVPLQFGVGFYFGEGHKTFFILLKGGVAWYRGVHPAYPEIVVNGNVIKEAEARTPYNGTYSFFTPTIGWQFDRAQVSASYQGHVEQDASLNVFNLSIGWRIY